MRLFSSLQSKVGKKFFAAFCLAAIGPMVIITLFIYGYTKDYLIESSSKQLQQESKLFNVIVLEKLHAALDEAYELIHSGSNTINKRIFASHTTEVLIPSKLRNISIEAARLSLNDAGHTIITIYDRTNQKADYFELTPQFLWGNADYLSERYGYCLGTEAGQKVYCSANSIFSSQLYDVEPFQSNWVDFGNDKMLVHSRAFATGTRLYSDGWNIFAAADKETVLAHIEFFKTLFALSLALTLLLVTWISRRLISKILSPLRALTGSTKKLSDQGYTENIEIEQTNDEFQSLVESFNKMNQDLKQQFSNLSSLNELDTKIINDHDTDSILCLTNESLINLLDIPFAITSLKLEAKGTYRTCIAQSDQTQAGAFNIRFSDSDINLEALELTEPSVEQVMLSPEEFVRLCPEIEKTTVSRDNINVACFLLRDKQTVIGFLMIGGKQPFTEDSREISIINSYRERLKLARNHKESLELLNLHANYDFLTGLPNRKNLVEHLEQQIGRSSTKHSRFMIIYLDLDNFKQVNDSLGHHIGDELLVEVSQRLTHVIAQQGIVARQGGDEFIIVNDITDDNEAAQAITAQRILDAFRKPVLLGGHYVNVSMSLGIALYPSDGDNIETLLMNADTALYSAKRLGKAQYLRYDRSMKSGALKRLELESDLRRSISEKQLSFFYQPIIDFENHKIGFEALIRWQHPEKGFYSPAEFIPVAEETGFIRDIHEWMFDVIFREAESLKRSLGSLYSKVSINISATQLSFPNFLDTIQSALGKTDLSPEDIEFELTESVYFENFSNSSIVLTKLCELGYKLALDDFGTGYSSLSYIQKLPFHRLKIDKSFIDEIDGTTQITPLLSTILGMANNLDMDVTAEGVETQSQLELIQSNSKCAIQGYVFSKPMVKHECEIFASNFRFE